MKSLLALAVILASPSFVSTAAMAQDYGPQQQQQQSNAYYAWCDNVEVILKNANRLATTLYGQTKFTQAKQVMVRAFQQAISSTNLPGAFRPNTYKELVRTLDLIQTLESANVPNQILKDKMVAYVTLNRVSFVLRVKNTLDRPYVIPCRSGCGGRGRSRVDMGDFEGVLASIAQLQLTTAQEYSSKVIPGRQIQVYPLVDTPTYFTIISKAAKWAAEDLSMTLFGSTFSCAISQLHNLGYDAADMAANAGEVYAVQRIHHIVDRLASRLDTSPYGCGTRYPAYADGNYDDDGEY